MTVYSSEPGDTDGRARPPSTVAVEPLVSVVVNNYNYERYVGQAIESALAQTYPRTEVVVVDDGSHDGSRAVVERYADRVTTVLKENGGQGSAFNAGFARSNGSIVIFLDSDDYLYPNAIERVVAAFDPSVAKVQFRLTVVDANGRAVGEYPPPDAPLHRGNVVPLLLEHGHYSTAVGSGNAYSRWALERVLPVPEDEFSYGADGYVNAIVPFQGEVRAIDLPLAAYRVHEGNFSDMGGRLDVSRFHYFIRHQLALERVILRAACEAGYPARRNLVLHYGGHLEARLASLRIDPGLHPVPGDRRLALTLRGVVAAWRYADCSTVRRLADIVWFIAVGLLPMAIAERAIAWKYVRTSRPRAVRLAVRQIRRVIG